MLQVARSHSNGTNVTGLNVGNYNLINGIRIGVNRLGGADYLDGVLLKSFLDTDSDV